MLGSRILIAVFALVIQVPAVWGACTGSSPTWTTTSDYVSVNTCVTNASNGDTINIQVGSATWSSTLNLGSKYLSLIGAGQGNTNITNNVGTLISAKGTGNNLLRISGFTIIGADNQTNIIDIIGPALKVRIDHITFNKGDNAIGTNYSSISATGPVYGVADHCQFINMKRPYFAADKRSGDSGVAWGTTAWNEFNSNPTSFPGSNKFMFFEDNQFIWNSSLTDNNAQGALYGQYGAKAVFRHNTLTGFCTYVDAHGDGPDYGTIMYEIYNNTFTENDANCGATDIIGMRGGQSIIHDNTFNVSLDPVHLLIYWPSCSNPSNPVPSSCELPSHRVNSTYVYGNTKCNESGGGCTTNQSAVVFVADSPYSGSESSSTFIQLSQQYYSSAPSSGQTYFPYTPYTYPHPLTNQTTSSAPQPTNLSANVQ